MNARARRAVLGALIADASALGLHWLYDPARIADVAGELPEFLEPDVRHYKGATGYFAHMGKRAGDPTHYGEQLLVALRSLAATGGALDPADYERRFTEAFGPGGTWVGYIDYPTRETLRRLDQAERDALSAARAFDLGAYEKDRVLMEAKVMANARRWRGRQLARAMRKAVEITHGDDPDLVRAGQMMARAVEAARGGFHGADDTQLPAVSKLPAVVAFAAPAKDLDATVEAAVRVTNDSDEAVAWARPVARALEAAIRGALPRQAAEAAVAAAGGPVRARLEEALAFAGGIEEAAEHFGRACPLAESVPVLVVAWRDAKYFASAVRQNILAGGDSAGRAICLGAVLAPSFGYPKEWAVRTRACAEAAALLGTAGATD